MANSAPRASVVLLSGGLDSAVCLWWARARGPVHALSVDYGQRHRRELDSARRLAARAGARHSVVRLALPWLKVSALVDRHKAVPDTPLGRIGRGRVPATYVPARNAVLLALGFSLAESVGARSVVLGQNVLDWSGYPDCRPEFNAAFEAAARLGTKAGVEGRPVRVEAPLMRLDKAGIARMAARLGVPMGLTWSCYRGGRRPCGRCDACRLRAKGFAEAGLADPALRA